MYGEKKRENGQWMTDGDPFYLPVVREWFAGVVGSLRANGNNDTGKILACEPYAGSLSLPRYVAQDMPELNASVEWFAYDIEPNPEPVIDGISIQYADTLLSIPAPVNGDSSAASPVNGDGFMYDVIVTNPPYLARNSATRRGIVFPESSRADMYQVALDTCLASAAYVASIIPESFITSKYPKNRCAMCVSLKHGLFTDTDCPVCLALFVPERVQSTLIVSRDGSALGTIGELVELDSRLLGDDGGSQRVIRFNDPNGDVGLHAADGSTRSIRFTRASEEDIPASSVKVSSRSLSRLSRVDGEPVTNEQIAEANRVLNEWRDSTGEVFMTAFKGPRKDGGYRRRLSFRDAARILARAINADSVHNDNSVPTAHNDSTVNNVNNGNNAGNDSSVSSSGSSVHSDNNSTGNATGNARGNQRSDNRLRLW